MNRGISFLLCITSIINRPSLDFAVILGNAYMSLFFAVGQASQALDQSMKAYAQAVRDCKTF